MTETLNIVAIIPARGGSKSIPQKNLMDFCGKPLLAWTIEQALASRHITDVFVSTDDEDIGRAARDHGAQVIKRPRKISTDTSSSEEALQHAIAWIQERKAVDTVVFLQATSPLRDDSDIDKALEKFFSEEADSLMSASALDDFLVWRIADGRPESVTYDYHNRGRRQERDPCFLENGSIYVFKPAVLKQHRNRLGGKMVFYTMPFWKSYEIDSPDDIDICEYYMRSRILDGKRGPGPELKSIELIVYDFDGVLTDNKVVVREDGLESVTANRADGLAIGRIKELGIPQIILSTETNKVVEARARKLGLLVLKGVRRKKETLEAYCRERNISLANTIYVGNDMNDYDAMRIAGYPVCPRDAVEEIRKISRIVLKAGGGEGVVRELLAKIT